MASRRIVITGMGMVSPLGLTVEESWQNLVAGKSGASAAVGLELPPNTASICASVKNFDPTPYINPKIVRKTDLFIQYGLVAAKQAMLDAKLDVTADNAGRIGVAVGSGIGGLPITERSHKHYLESGGASSAIRRISPMFIPSVIINMLAGHISMEFGVKGPNLAIVTACTTGAHNIGMASRCIAYGDADVMLVGGSEMATCALGLIGFSAMRALSTRTDAPEKASRPWDRERDGFVLGDGAGILVLEEYEHAKRRGAHIYAELAGFGMSSDAYHVTLPDQEGTGFVACMLNAIKDAGLTTDSIDYINAHGTSTPAGDEIEAMAVKKVFGEHAYKLAMSSTKSMTGHLLGAAGAVEAIFSVLAIRDQIAPPTINLDNPAEECMGMNLVAHKSQKIKIDVTLSNSFGFGGTNASLVFKRI